MANAVHLDVSRRHDFVLLFEVTDGNPNGDPDAGNLPRVDPETMQGLVTDVALKRKIRDWVDLTRGDEGRYKIYVQHRGILRDQQKRAFVALKKEPTDRADDEARDWMCANFYDIRLFGAVMTMGKSGQKAKGGKDLQWNCGQVRGPVQITFARSIDPIVPLDLSITRVALTNPGDTGADVGEDEETARSGQMGRKSIVPYGLYRAHGFFNAHLAKQTGVDAVDLELLWRALEQMWEFDRSAARGMMACRGLYVFTHDSPLGNAPAHKLFERIKVARKPGVEASRAFVDYEVTVDRSEAPGVTLSALVEAVATAG
jgi:CRISPR-associated protein Csd2